MQDKNEIAKIDELRTVLIEAKTNPEVYDQLLSALYYIGKNEIYELKSEVYALLFSEDEHIRQSAVSTLGFSTRLYVPEFKNQAYQIFVSDPSEIVKHTALLAWINYNYDSVNKKVIIELYKIFTDENNSSEIRATAHNGIFLVIDYYNQEFRTYMIDTPMYVISNEAFNNLVNMDVLTSIMLNYAPEIFDRGTIIDV